MKYIIQWNALGASHLQRKATLSILSMLLVRHRSGFQNPLFRLGNSLLLVFKLSDICLTVIRRLSGSCQAVVKHSTGGCWTVDKEVVGQSLGSRRAVAGQLSGSRREVIGQSSESRWQSLSIHLEVVRQMSGSRQIVIR